MGKPNRMPSEVKKTGKRSPVARCRRLAQMDRFIDSLPLGFDTLTGENGLLLSGGERQRLAVARAILKDAPILILDEATANLDAETERQLWKALEEVMVGRTTLIISHHMELTQIDKVML